MDDDFDFSFDGKEKTEEEIMAEIDAMTGEEVDLFLQSVNIDAEKSWLELKIKLLMAGIPIPDTW